MGDEDGSVMVGDGYNGSNQDFDDKEGQQYGWDDQFRCGDGRQGSWGDSPAD